MPIGRTAAPTRGRFAARRASIAVVVVGVLLVALPAQTSSIGGRRPAAMDVGAGSGSGSPVPAASLAPPPATPPVDAAPALNPDCRYSGAPLARADELMANRYRLGGQPLVTLPTDPSWTENPLGDANWAFRFHSMRYVLDLLTAGRLTADPRYTERALFLLHDWSIDNPRDDGASSWSWNDHTTALRALVLACAADQTPMTTWLHDALVLHGQTLADPAFYRKTGNHALNQDLALLEVARVLHRADWLTLAGQRINTLIVGSVDAEGVTNEQSVGYELYNYKRYVQAKARLLAVGLTPSAVFDRIDRMPTFLAHATLPNGAYEQIGDTSGRAGRIPGTVAEYAATLGASGPKPATTIALYRAGYLFARSGWGERRPPADETFFSVKWGPGPVFHGHPDGLSVTLAAYGSRLLVDPGTFSYNPGPVRAFFKGRSAHNILTVDGATWSLPTVSRLLGYRQAARYVDVRLQAAGYPGVTHTRRLTWSRALDYLLVEDRLTSARVHTYRQLWHLVEDARPVLGAATVTTQRAKGNLLIRQLTGAPKLRVISGAMTPVQGWISYGENQRIAAPVVEAIQRGRSVRYLTLIVPASGAPAARVSGLRLTSTGYSVTVTIGARSERVTVSGASIWIHDLP